MPISLLLIIATVTQTFNLPPGLLSAVCYTESGYHERAVHRDDGNANSVGVCQLQHPTAVALGFTGSEKELYNPVYNVYFAGKYLRRQLDRYDGQSIPAISAYNAGSYRERQGKPVNQAYVYKVIKAWSEGK